MMAEVVPTQSRLTLADQLTADLRAYILDGYVQPGQRMREEKLASHFGCGRGPVREAMARLAERGLLVKQPYSGYSMRDLRVVDIRNYYTVRERIELLAIELCWPLRDRTFISNLTRLHDRLTDAVSVGIPIRSVDAEAEFHAAVYIASGNEPLLRCWDLLACYRDLYYVTLRKRKEESDFAPAPMSASHKALLKALIGDSLDAALDATREHLRLGLDQFERAQEEHADKAEEIHWNSSSYNRR